MLNEIFVLNDDLIKESSISRSSVRTQLPVFFIFHLLYIFMVMYSEALLVPRNTLYETMDTKILCIMLNFYFEKKNFLNSFFV